MDEDKLKKAYESASVHYDMPDFETFKADMQDDEKLAKFRGSLAEHYDVPEFDQFKSDMIPFKKKEPTIALASQSAQKGSVSATEVSKVDGSLGSSAPEQGVEATSKDFVAKEATFDWEQAPAIEKPKETQGRSAVKAQEIFDRDFKAVEKGGVEHKAILQAKVDKETKRKDFSESINENIINLNESDAVEELTKEYGHLGFSFYKTGIGDAIEVQQNSTGKTEVFDLMYDFSWNKKARTTERNKLGSFIYDNQVSEKEQESLEKMSIKEYEDFVVKDYIQNPEKYSQETPELLTKILASKTKDFTHKVSQYNQDTESLEGAIKEFNEKVLMVNGVMTPELKTEEIELNKHMARLNKELESLKIEKAEFRDNSKDIESAALIVARDVFIKNEKEGSTGGYLWNKTLDAAKQFGGVEAKSSIAIQMLPYFLPNAGMPKQKYDELKSQGLSDEEIRDVAKKSMATDLMPGIGDGFRGVLGSSTTKAYEQSEDRGQFIKAMGSVIESLGAVASGGSSKGLRFMGLAGMSYAHISTEMRENPEFADVSENEKNIVAIPYAIAAGVLENLGFNKLLKNNPLAQSFIAKAISATLKKLPKNASSLQIEKAINGEIKNKFKAGAVKIVDGYLVEGETGFAQEIASIGIKDVYNAVKGKDMFDSPDFFSLEALEQEFEAGKDEALGGFIMAGAGASINIMSNGLKSSKVTNDVAKILQGLSSSGEFKTLTTEYLKTKIISGEMTRDEAKETLQAYDDMMGNMNKIPAEVKDVTRAFDLISEKTKLEKEIEGKDKALVVDKTERIAEIDAEMNTIARTAPDSKPEDDYDAAIDDVVNPKRNKPTTPGAEVVPAGKKLFNDPNPETAEISKKYKEDNGIETEAGEVITTLDTDRASKIADEYEKAVDSPNDPETQESYTSMADETLSQYDPISEAGYEVEIWEGEGEPYANSEEMIKDVKENKHMYIYSTEAGFGDAPITEEQRRQNKLLQDSGVKDKNGKPLLYNDVFRFVHDFFGHTERGNGFGPKGEENAWDIHARMYSDKARRAMTSETRGQNSWVNFGPQMRNDDGSLKKKGDEGFLPAKDRAFAPQKMVLLPKEYSEISGKKSKVKQESTKVKQGTTKVNQETTKVKQETTKVKQETTKVKQETTKVKQETQPATEESMRTKFKETKGERQQKVVRAAHKVVKSLKNIPGVKVYIHDTTDAYNSAIAKTTGESKESIDTETQKSLGEYIAGKGEIHINLENESTDATTVYHEAFHAIFEAKGIESGAAKEMVDGLKKIVKDKKLIERIDKFVSNYEAGEQSEEFMAEVTGMLSDAAQTLDANGLHKLINLINKIAKKIIGAPIFKATASRQEVLDFINKTATDLSAGLEVDVETMTGMNPFISSLEDRRKKQLTEKESVKISREVVSKTKKGKNYPTLKVFKKPKGKSEYVSFEGEINQDNVKKELPSSYNSTASKLSIYNTFDTSSINVDIETITPENKNNHVARVKENKGKIDKKITSAKKELLKIRNKKYKNQSDKKIKIEAGKEKIKSLVDLRRSKTIKEMSDKILAQESPVLKSSLHNDLIYNIGDNFTVLNAKDKISKSESVYKIAKDTVKRNLLSVYNNVSPAIRAISKLWYDGANLIAQDWAKKYDISLEQASAIIATQSPQMPWFDNLHLAHVVMDTLSSEGSNIFTEEMYNNYVLKSKGYAAQVKYIPNVKNLIGKKLSDLNDYDASIYVRLNYDSTISRKAPVRIPTGTNVNVTQKGDSSFSGYDVIEKGVSVFRDGSDKNIDEKIGKANKVRNFYLNIADPSNKRAVTIDTHAMAIALMKPLASNDFEVNFGPASFAFYADAYRELSSELNIEARALQSITWEAARAIFPAKKKAEKGYKSKMSSIWDMYNNNELSIEDVHSEIFKQADNPNKTEWSEYIGILKNKNERKNVSGRIIRKQESRSTDRVGDFSGIDSGISESGVRSDSTNKGTKVTPSRKKRVMPKNESEKLTVDKDGNYYFENFAHSKKTTLKPSLATGVGIQTSKEERDAINSVGGLTMLYTMKGQTEKNVGTNKHKVVIPKDKVYYIQDDVNNYYAEAKRQFSEARPGQAFNPNYQGAWITKVANENGYDIAITKWRGNELRAQTTLDLKPTESDTEFTERIEDTYKVGDNIFVYGDDAKVTGVKGDVVSFEYSTGGGTINVVNSKRSIRKKRILRPANEINKKVSAMKKEGMGDNAIKAQLKSEMHTDKEIRNAILEHGFKEEGIFIRKDKSKKSVFINMAVRLRKRYLLARKMMPKSSFYLKESMNAMKAYNLNKAEKLVTDFSRLHKKYKGDKNKLEEDFDAYVRGDKSVSIPEEFKIIANKMRNQVDMLSQFLIDAGAADGELIDTIKANLGTYMHRSFRVHDRKNWINEVTEEAKQRAKDYLRKEHRKMIMDRAIRNETLFEDEMESYLEGEIENMLTQDVKDIQKKARDGAKDISVFKKLDEELSPELRELLGEYTEPDLVFAKTVLKLTTLAAHHQFLSNVKRTGLNVFLFEKDQIRPEGYNVKIAAEGSDAMSPLDGLYTSQEIKDSLDPESGELGKLMKIYMRIISSIKWAKTIGSPATHAKNVFGNIPFLAINGHVNVEDWGGAYNTVQNDFRKLDREGQRAKMLHYISLGIVKQSAGLGEVKDMFKDAEWDMALATRLKGRKLNFLEKTKKFTSRQKKVLEDAYQAQDDFFKIIAYESELARYSKAVYNKKPSELTESEKTKIDKIAAEIVKNTLPMYDRVPEAIQKLRRSPLVGSFVAFTAESYRTAGNTAFLAVKEIRDPNPKIKKIGYRRLIGASAYITAKSAVLSYGSYMIGAGAVGMFGALTDNDEEEEKEKDLRKFIAYWSNKNDLYFKKVGGGKFSYIDVGGADPHGAMNKVVNSLLLGDSSVEAVSAAFESFIEPFVGKEIATEAALSIASNKDGYNRDIYNVTDNNVEKAESILGFLKGVFEPGAVTSAEKIWEADEKAIEVIAASTGYRYKEVDINQQAYYIVKKMILDERKAKERYNKAFYDYEEGEISEAQLNTEYNKSNSRVKLIRKDIMGIYESAVRLGVKEEDIIKTYKTLNITNKVLEEISQGKILDIKRKDEVKSNKRPARKTRKTRKPR